MRGSFPGSARSILSPPNSARRDDALEAALPVTGMPHRINHRFAYTVIAEVVLVGGVQLEDRAAAFDPIDDDVLANALVGPVDDIPLGDGRTFLPLAA